MPSIGIINEDGVQVEQQVVSREASIESDARGEINPSIVQRVKFDHKGQMSSITSECGETENRRQADNNANITVEGLIQNDEINDLRSLKNEEEILFVSDIFSGNVIVERLSIVQSTDVLYLKVGGEEELAFNFQMQLKQP